MRTDLKVLYIKQYWSHNIEITDGWKKSRKLFEQCSTNKSYNRRLGGYNSNMFCPYCGNKYISHFENNRPVADFFCPSCMEEYELKSKGGSISNKMLHVGASDR